MKKFLLTFLLVSLLSCQEDDNTNERYSHPIGITLCGTKDPSWLTDEIGEILQHESKRPIGVYLYEEETDYVAITDYANSEYDKIIRFFTCSGILVDKSNPAYSVLTKAFQGSLFQLVWSNEGVTEQKE